MKDGYIKLHRKVMDSAVFCNANLWKVWCWCLLRANHRKTSILFNGAQLYLEAGQFVSGRFAGSDECKMHPSTFRNKLSQLKNMGNLDIQSDNKKSIITVVKWSKYQIRESVEDSRTDNNRTTTGQQQDTDKNVRMEEQDCAFDANDAFASLWQEYPRRLGKRAALRHFLASVKSQADLERIRVALANYKAKLAKDKTEEKYIQHGSTWFNNWQDWEQVETKPKSASPLKQFGGDR